MSFDTLRNLKAWWATVGKTRRPNPFALPEQREKAEYRQFIWDIRGQWIAARKSLWKELSAERRSVEKLVRVVADDFSEGLDVLHRFMRRAVYDPPAQVDVSELPDGKFGFAARKVMRASRVRLARNSRQVQNWLNWIADRRAILAEWRDHPWIISPVEAVGVPGDYPTVPDASVLLETSYRSHSTLFVPPAQSMSEVLQDAKEELYRRELLRRWEWWTKAIPNADLAVHQVVAASPAIAAMVLDRVFDHAGLGDELSLRPCLIPDVSIWQPFDGWLVQLHGPYRAWLKSNGADVADFAAAPYPPHMHVRPDRPHGEIGLRSPPVADAALHGLCCFIAFLLDQLTSTAAGSDVADAQALMIQGVESWADTDEATPPRTQKLPLKAANLSRCRIAVEWATSGMLLRVSVNNRDWHNADAVPAAVRHVVEALLEPLEIQKVGPNDVRRFCVWFNSHFELPDKPKPLVRKGKRLFTDWQLVTDRDGSSRELAMDPAKLDGRVRQR